MIPSNSACLDTSAVICLLDPKKEPERHRSTFEVFVEYKKSGMVFLPDMAFAEASVAFKSAIDLRTALNELGIVTVQADDEALFLAGRVFDDYRKNKGGPKDGVLPDFIIGAVAKTSGAALVTFNVKDFVSRFPDLEIIEPSSLS